MHTSMHVAGGSVVGACCKGSAAASTRNPSSISDGTDLLSILKASAALCFLMACSKLFGMGVADGIYMWREMGIDAGRMSRELMSQCKSMIEADNVDVFKGTELPIYTCSWLHHS